MSKLLSVLFVLMMCVGVRSDVCRDNNKALRNCQRCSDQEMRTIDICKEQGLRKITCTNGDASYYTCTYDELNYFASLAVQFGMSEFAFFQSICLVIAIVCGWYMKQRKSYLVSLQQIRYNKLLET